MASNDWKTVASDLQRAVNNLAWFVLESMAVPEQPQFTSMQHWPMVYPQPPPQPPLPTTPSLSESVSPPKKKCRKDMQQKATRSVGADVDRLVLETIV